MTNLRPKLSEYLHSSFSPVLINNSELDSGWIDFEDFDKYQFEGRSGAVGMTNGAVTQTSNSTGENYRIATSTGTGSAVFRIDQILNSNYESQTSKYVILNGTSVVIVNVDAMRCSRAKSIMSGSLGTSSGVVTIRQQVDTANIFAVVPTTGQTAIAAYTIPSGKIGVIKRLDASITRANGSAGSANINFNIREPYGSWRAIRILDLQTGGDKDKDLVGGMVLTEGYDMKLTIESVSDNDTIASGEFEMFLINE